MSDQGVIWYRRMTFRSIFSTINKMPVGLPQVGKVCLCWRVGLFVTALLLSPSRSSSPSTTLLNLEMFNLCISLSWLFDLQRTSRNNSNSISEDMSE